MKSQEKKSIFKEGAKLLVEKVNMDDPKVKEEIEEIKKEQKEILEMKNVDVKSLKLVIQL